jgi:pilus assembly protein Flp/PilA
MSSLRSFCSPFLKMGREKNIMIRTFMNLHNEESGQDLIEYALVVALIALAATAGMSSLANGINSAFTRLNTILGNKIS